jgi:hypothetical protein
LENLLGFGTKKQKRHLWRMDQKTLKHKRIRIPNEIKLVIIPTKQSYSKQVEIIKMWKKVGEGEET